MKSSKYKRLIEHCTVLYCTASVWLHCHSSFAIRQSYNFYLLMLLYSFPIGPCFARHSNLLNSIRGHSKLLSHPLSIGSKWQIASKSCLLNNWWIGKMCWTQASCLNYDISKWRTVDTGFIFVVKFILLSIRLMMSDDDILKQLTLICRVFNMLLNYQISS